MTDTPDVVSFYLLSALRGIVHSPHLLSHKHKKRRLPYPPWIWQPALSPPGGTRR